MKLSLYTCVRNGIFLDYHVVDMVKHHLPLFDEIIVHDGNSSDGTAAELKKLGNKVRLFSTKWGEPKGEEWFADFKNLARQQCTGDWCILLDPDEFIPEWEFERLRETIRSTEFPILRLEWIHFYGNYLVYNSNPGKSRWAEYKYQVHRNLPDMAVWGDGSNVRLGTQRLESSVGPDRFICHHFGMVRKASRLRQKLRTVSKAKQRRRWKITLPSFIFDLMPYDWFDEDFLSDLRVFKGDIVKAVLENPNEFVRDDWKLLRYLEKAGLDRA